VLGDSRFPDFKVGRDRWAIHKQRNQEIGTHRPNQVRRRILSRQIFTYQHRPSHRIQRHEVQRSRRQFNAFPAALQRRKIAAQLIVNYLSTIKVPTVMFCLRKSQVRQ